MDIPEQEEINRDISLKCLFKLHLPALLYSVKWYKDGSEFYRYLPGETPPARAFSLPGISVNLSHSDEHGVLLQSLKIVSSGMYLCEVSTEAPFFHTVSGYGILTVIGGLRISGLRGLYMVGDMVEANCTSPPSKPVTHITWYMNDKQMAAEWLVDYGISAEFTSGLDSDESTNLHVATKGIRLPATQITFPNRILKLSCMARLGSQQWEQQRWTFLIHHHVSGLGSANWSREGGQFVAAILVLILNSS